MRFRYDHVALFFLVVILVAVLMTPTRFDMARLYRADYLYDKALTILEALELVSRGERRLLYEKAGLLFDMGRYEESAHVLEGLRARFPSDPSPWRLSERVYAALGDPLRRAEMIEGRLAREGPDSAALRLLAEIYAWRQRPDSALGALVRLEREAPAETEARARTVEIALRLGRLDMALERLRARYQENPADTYASYLIGQIFLSERRVDDFVAFSRERLERGRGDREVAMQMAATLVSVGRSGEALPILERIVAGDPGDPEARRSLAYLYAERSDSRALGLMAGLNEEDPGDADVAATLASLLARAGRSAEAETLLSAILRRDPSNAAVRRDLAWIHADRGRYGQVLAILGSGPGLPGDFNLAMLKAEALRRTGRRAESRRVYEALLARNPSSREARLALAAAALEEGRRDEARALYRSILRADPRHGGALKGLALTSLAENPVEARRALARALKILPRDPEIRLWLGDLLRERRPEAARAHYEEALRLMGASRVAGRNPIRATILSRLGRRGESIDLLRRLVAQNPGDDDLRNDLAETLIDAKRYDEAMALLEGGRHAAAGPEGLVPK